MCKYLLVVWEMKLQILKETVLTGLMQKMQILLTYLTVLRRMLMQTLKNLSVVLMFGKHKTLEKF